MVLMQNGDQIAGGGMPVIHITQAQYDANPSAYNDPNVLVHITDAPSGHLMGADMSYDANMNYNDIGNITTKSLGKVEYKADNKALYPHAVGDYFINKDGEYCKCTSAISVGQTLTKNTNYVVTDVGSEIKGINGKLTETFTVEWINSNQSKTFSVTNGLFFIQRSNYVKCVIGKLYDEYTPFIPDGQITFSNVSTDSITVTNTYGASVGVVIIKI